MKKYLFKITITKIQISILLVFILFNSVSCTEEKKQSPEFFPKMVFSSDDIMQNYLTTYYSKLLSGLGESSIYNLKKNNEVHVYRFLYSPPFDGPTSIRLEILKSGGRGGLLTIKSTEKHTYSNKSENINIVDEAKSIVPGKIKLSKKVCIRQWQVDAWLEKVEHMRFTAMPYWVNEYKGHDPSTWILEGLNGNRYHIVRRLSPYNGRFRECIDLLVKYAGLNTQDWLSHSKSKYGLTIEFQLSMNNMENKYKKPIIDFLTVNKFGEITGLMEWSGMKHSELHIGVFNPDKPINPLIKKLKQLKVPLKTKIKQYYPFKRTIEIYK